MTQQATIDFDQERESIVTRINDGEVSCSMPKSCVCILRIADIMRYMPQSLLIQGFRKGKALRRAQSLRKRMDARHDD